MTTRDRNRLTLRRADRHRRCRARQTTILPPSTRSPVRVPEGVERPKEVRDVDSLPVTSVRAVGARRARAPAKCRDPRRPRARRAGGSPRCVGSGLRRRAGRRRLRSQIPPRAARLQLDAMPRQRARSDAQLFAMRRARSTPHRQVLDAQRFETDLNVPPSWACDAGVRRRASATSRGRSFRLDQTLRLRLEDASVRAAARPDDVADPARAERGRGLDVGQEREFSARA